jgi:hypothetical protein
MCSTRCRRCADAPKVQKGLGFLPDPLALRRAFLSRFSDLDGNLM